MAGSICILFSDRPDYGSTSFYLFESNALACIAALQFLVALVCVSVVSLYIFSFACVTETTFLEQGYDHPA